MGSGHCLLWFFFSYHLLAVFLSPITAVSADEEETKITGPETRVTKRMSFPDFSVSSSRIVEDIKLLGSAKFSEQKGGVVQIPDDHRVVDLKHQAGRAIHSSLIRVLDPITQTPASFKTTFSFQFSKSSHLVNSSKEGEEPAAEDAPGGSGLAFIIVPDEFTVGRPGPWLGILNDACEENYKAVAVEFDTRQNPEFGDPNDDHVGVNLGSIVSFKTFNVSNVGVSLKDESILRAWITYDGPRRWMDIRLARNDQDYPSKPIFAGSLDISPYLKEYMFVGFSASTGNNTQFHKILSWNFTATSQASLRVPTEETCQSKIAASLESKLSKNSHAEPMSNFLIFAAAVVLAAAILVSLFCNRKRILERSNDVTLPDVKMRPRPPNKPRRFSITEISCATRNFSEEEILGGDSRGVFYRGKLSNNWQVAVKRFSTQFLNSQGLDKRRILKEVGSISRARHPNLVPIKGWSYDKHEILVVYDFCPNGSLDKWLFGIGALPWSRRLKVVKDVADSLSFLHTNQLSHKNMKTSSVLLDVSFRAALGDFGFVLLASESRRFEAEVSQKADVFEFGIFLLEVVSGRRRREEGMEVGEKDLLDFAWRMQESNEKARLVDKRIGSVINMEQAIRVLDIGLLCTLNEDKGRPCMEEVVEFLSMEKAVPELPSTRPMVLFPYSSNTGLCTGYSCGSLMKPHF